MKNQLLLRSLTILMLGLLANAQAKDLGEQRISTHTNKLISEKSPYLIQHAHNPVDWYPWGEEAFQKAKKEDKPIFLSIGYATCHWCHVMAHESFENEDIAALMNDAFVNVKLDREERPDIDNIYMSVVQMMTGSGGWPMSIVMTPDKKPFFAATYIPPTSRWGRLGMTELIPKIKDAWKNRRKELLASSEEIVQRLQTIIPASDELPDLGKVLTSAVNGLKESFDEQNGGFSTKPKFPTPHNLLLLMRYSQRTGDKDYQEMAFTTLRKMRGGGVYDHIGFGFHRYSTDEKWLLPHFEKMLYDQALLLMAYTEAYQITGEQLFKDTALEIITYVLRDMTDPSGAFYCAEDADSEGVEGKFYVWSDRELAQVLTASQYTLFKSTYHITTTGNFHDEATGKPGGENIPHCIGTAVIPSPELETIRQKLFTHRKKRIHPLKDDKVITDWNGLMLAGLSQAARVFNDSTIRAAADKAAGFITNNMVAANGKLQHLYKDQETSIIGTVDDYAFSVFGLIEAYQTTGKVVYLKTAIKINSYLLANFWDKKHGGLFITDESAEKLISRPKEIYDGAIPSANSVSVLNLLKLSRLTGKSEYEDRANDIVKAFTRHIEQHPQGYTQLMNALEFAHGTSYEIVVVGKNHQTVSEYTALLDEVFLPNKVVLLKTPETSSELATVAEYSENLKMINGQTTVYICKGFTCDAPITSLDELKKKILTLK